MQVRILKLLLAVNRITLLVQIKIIILYLSKMSGLVSFDRSFKLLNIIVARLNKDAGAQNISIVDRFHKTTLK